MLVLPVKAFIFSRGNARSGNFLNQDGAGFPMTMKPGPYFRRQFWGIGLSGMVEGACNRR